MNVVTGISRSISVGGCGQFLGLIQRESQILSELLWAFSTQGHLYPLGIVPSDVIIDGHHQLTSGLLLPFISKMHFIL